MAYSGFGSFVGFGAESTWGTAVSRTKFFRLLSSSLRRNVSKVKRETLYEGTGLVSRRSFVAQDDVGGSVSFEGTYEDMGLILHHAMWSSSTTGPSGSDYTHTYILGATAPAGGLTIEIAQGTGSAIVYEGCRIAKIKMSVEAGGRCVVEIEIIGQTSGAPTSAGTPTFGTSEVEMEHHQFSQITWNSTAYDLRTFSLELDNKLDRRQVLGTKLTADPKPSALRDVSMMVSSDYESDNWQSGLTAHTQASAVISATASARSITFTMHNAYIETDEIGVNTHGVLPESIKLVGQSDATNRGLAVVVVNTQSTATS